MSNHRSFFNFVSGCLNDLYFDTKNIQMLIKCLVICIDRLTLCPYTTCVLGEMDMAATLRMVTTQLSEPLFHHLETYAKEINRSKSWIVRQAITEWLDRNAKSADTAQTESKADRRFKDELFALIQEAHDSG